MLMIIDFQGQKSLEIILAEFSASSPQKFNPDYALQMPKKIILFNYCMVSMYLFPLAFTQK